MKLLFCAIASCLLSAAIAADITVVGEWNEKVDSRDFAGGSGSKRLERASMATVDISNTGNGSWRVLARVTEHSWHRSLKLSVRRTSAGKGVGSVSGGEGHIALTSSDTEIFRGSGDRSSIKIETKLSGVSVKLPPDAYSGGVIFTVVP